MQSLRVGHRYASLKFSVAHRWFATLFDSNCIALFGRFVAFGLGAPCHDWPIKTRLPTLGIPGGPAPAGEWTNPIASAWLPAANSLGDELIVIRFIKQLADILGTLCLFQESAKGFIAQLAGNILQRPQMVSRPVWR